MAVYEFLDVIIDNSGSMQHEDKRTFVQPKGKTAIWQGAAEVLLAL